MQVYLHLPFCHRICPYCSFYKHTPGNTDMRAFINALNKEAQHYSQQLNLNAAPINTLYLGGGTPSMLSQTLLTRLFSQLQSSMDLSSLQEFTFEANPATFKIDKALFFKSLGITRVSLGIQSFDDSVLRTLGREHTAEQAIHSVSILREASIPEINIDLMFSIPGQSLSSWENTLKTAIALQPDHLSAYNLTYEEDTEFLQKLTAGDFQENAQTNARYFSLAHDMLSDAGFDHYETSNYARKGKRSQHNSSYWQGDDYLGIGPSAVSTVQSKRWKNIPDTSHYIKQINCLGHAQTEIENLSSEDLRLERIALMLRTSQGISMDLLNRQEKTKINALVEEQLANTTQTTLYLTREGSLLVDSIVEYLIS